MFNDIVIGPITIHMYGVMIAAGFLAALLMTLRRGKKRGYDEDIIWGIFFCAIIGGMLGTRILYYIVEIPEIMKDPSILWDFKNGYVVYQAQNRVTVFPIEDISGYRYSSVAGNGYGCDLTESYFEEAEWYLRFVLRGEDRLSINLDSRNQKRCISLSSAMEEIQLGESTAPDMEEMIVQQMVTESMMDMLTDKQKELIYALYFEKQTYQEYADIHGISSAAVNNMRNKAVAKLRASLEELAESNEKKKLRKK